MATTARLAAVHPSGAAGEPDFSVRTRSGRSRTARPNHWPRHARATRFPAWAGISPTAMSKKGLSKNLSKAHRHSPARISCWLVSHDQRPAGSDRGPSAAPHTTDCRDHLVLPAVATGSAASRSSSATRPTNRFHSCPTPSGTPMLCPRRCAKWSPDRHARGRSHAREAHRCVASLCPAGRRRGLGGRLLCGPWHPDRGHELKSETLRGPTS